MKKKSVEYSLKAKKQEFEIEQIKSSLDAFNYAKKFYFDDILIYESTFIILLNSRLNTIGFAKISQGGLSETIVDVRLIAKFAIESLASHVILVHNHPSGGVKPSRQDELLTSSLEKGLSFLNIKLVEHIIISENEYYSFSDEGKL